MKIQTLFHQKQWIHFAIIMLFLMLLRAPAYGDVVLNEMQTIEFSVLSNATKPIPFFLFPQDNRKTRGFLLADGFVLCELLTLGNTKLNVCYIKKDIATKPILDLKRFFFEVTLDF